MKFEVCMKFECKNCKKESMCFKEGAYYEYSKNRHRKVKSKKDNLRKKMDKF